MKLSYPSMRAIAALFYNITYGLAL
jgi:hypothetical protein